MVSGKSSVKKMFLMAKARIAFNPLLCILQNQILMMMVKMKMDLRSGTEVVLSYSSEVGIEEKTFAWSNHNF